MMDEAIEAMSDIKDVDSSELLVNSIIIQSASKVSVTVLDMACTVTLVEKPLPPGMVGSPGLTGKVNEKKDCDSFSEDVATESFEVISKRLAKAASLGKVVESVSVSKTKTGKTKIKLAYD